MAEESQSELKEVVVVEGELIDYLMGSIYGTCCGDAIGLLTEFMNKDQAKLYYGEKKGLEFTDSVRDMHRSRWKFGDWTDDSDQMILILDTILAKDKADCKEFGYRLSNWARHGFPELGDHVGMGIGATTSHVLRLFESKKDLTEQDPHHAARFVWEETGREVAPNGGVMRTGVLGIFNYQNIEEVIENTQQIAKVTHYDPRCQASCIAVTTAISLMLQRKAEHLTSKGSLKIEDIIDCCYKYAKTVVEKKRHKKELKAHMYCKDVKKLKLDEQSKIGYTYKAMGAGFWALRQNDFRVAIEAVTMQAGDADSNCAVAGALLGCKLGYSKIPTNWTGNLLHKKWLDEKLHRFFDLQNIEHRYESKEPKEST